MKKLLVVSILVLICIPIMIKKISTVYAEHPTADITGDGTVNLEDLSVMSQQWMTTGSLPIEPNVHAAFGVYTGNNNGPARYIYHNLGCVPNLIFVFPMQQTGDVMTNPEDCVPIVIFQEGGYTYYRRFDDFEIGKWVQDPEDITDTTFKVGSILWYGGQGWMGNYPEVKYFFVAIRVNNVSL